jgi:hypothetical protein
MSVKMAVFAPMPRARERIATVVKPGFLARTRKVERRFCQRVPMAWLLDSRVRSCA